MDSPELLSALKRFIAEFDFNNVACTYDASGNMTLISFKLNDTVLETWKMTYDASNNLLTAARLAGKPLR